MITGYSLRQQAQADLESIWLYSYKEWGTEQADHYIRSLLSRFTWLSENPHPGYPQGAGNLPGFTQG